MTAMYIHESLRGASDKRELHAWESAVLVSGAGAGVAYNVALFLADMVNSAKQAELRLRRLCAGCAQGVRRHRSWASWGICRGRRA
ncbi:hypothetical protein C8Q70DRAFT_1036193 [Cubamyces menziesii]|nr:hypothetical protein C8Q70DRAFT_1036193 [Cubamyces menziesii]